MLRNIIVLPDGTELTYGAGSGNVINSTKTTECVNIGDDLNPGSAFANILEVTLRTPDGNLSLTAGDEVTLYKVDDGGSRSQVGVYTLEKPTRPKANTMKLTGYDHVAKLDKDLTEWLKALDGWPYTVAAFAGMVCQECGLTFVESEVPNSNFPIQQFSKTGVTGRQIMRWLGEICCRFVRATAAGNIEFGWYTHAQKAITPSGDPYIFAGGLSYETYQVAKVDAVQLRLADSTEGALWPAVEEGANSYIISGNAILLSRVTDELLPYLDVIKTELSAMTYTPCKVSIPANLDINAGSIVDITDKNGKTVTTYVMTKTTSGHRDTLESTGSPRRDSPGSMNNKSESYKINEALDGQTQDDIFKKLTENGKLKGLFMEDGELYINVSYLRSKVIGADLIDADLIDVENLFAEDITMTGKFVSEGEAYLPPTYEDVLYLLWHILLPDRYPLPAGYSFDLNGDGTVNEDDVIAALDVVKGKTAMKDLPGATKTPVKIIIDMSDPEKAFRIVGTNIWGTEVDVFVGADVNNCSFVAKSYFDRLFSSSDDQEGCYYRSMTEEIEWINPPMHIDTVYRTTERWMGKPVYTKLIDFGTMPSLSTKYVTHNLPVSHKNVVGMRVIATNDNETIELPAGISGNFAGYAWCKSDTVAIRATADLSSYTAFVELKWIADD